MAKIFPDFQTFLGASGDDTIGVTKITLAQSEVHFSIPKATDARIVTPTYGGTVQNFYLNAAQTRVSVDGTVGDKVTIVSRHRGMLNFGEQE